MEKGKKEKLILLILLPIFALGLVFRLSGGMKKNQPGAATPASAAEAMQTEYLEREIKALDEIKTKLKEKVEYAVINIADPFKDKLNEYIKSIIATRPEEEVKAPHKEVQLPQLDITGLVWNTDRPQAIINGYVVSIGDEIEGVKLLSVEKDGVGIEYKGYEFFINKTTRQNLPEEPGRKAFPRYGGGM